MGKDKGNNCGTGYQAKTERAGTIMPTMNEWQQQIAEERKAQEKWQTMTLEGWKLKSYAFKENCRSSCKWLGLKQKRTE